MHELRIPIRWPDFDALGHVNNVVYLYYLDAARDDLLERSVGDWQSWPTVTVHASIDYRREIQLGARDVLVRTRVIGVGRSSIRFEQEVRAPDEEVAASAASVIVAWDASVRATRAIEDDDRRRLLGWS